MRGTAEGQAENPISARGAAAVARNQKSVPTPRRVLIAAGGTGGHIFPALAVAQELRRRWEARSEPEDREAFSIEFVGTARGLESRLIPAAGFRLHAVAAAPLKRMGALNTTRNLLVLPRSFWETGSLLRARRPGVVVGLGGYVAGPLLLEAALARIPTLLIEPNASPGFTNRVLARWVRVAALGFQAAAPYYGDKARLTGHPVREGFTQVRPKEHTPPFTLLILGGSQGSVAINSAMIGALPLFAQQARRFRVIHQTGQLDFERVRHSYQGAPLEAEVVSFIEDLPPIFERADLVICRSGASTLGELDAAGKASVLIPFPAAADNHQLANARLLEGAGAAQVIEQRQLTPEKLFERICSLVDRPDTLIEMDQKARTLAHPDAASRIAGLIEGLAPMK